MQRLPSDDGGPQSALESPWQDQQREKTSQEKTEEEIVLDYVKKQSRQEAEHQMKGKARATAEGDKEEDDMRRALELSKKEYESRGSAVVRRRGFEQFDRLQVKKGKE
jgi:hypothetical protein